MSSPTLQTLPAIGNALLGAGLGLHSDVSTGTFASTNTATSWSLGLADLELSAYNGATNALGTRFPLRRITLRITNNGTSQTLTGISLALQETDAGATTPDPAPITLGQATGFPSGGLASGDSVTVTYSILGGMRRYPVLTGTMGAAPTAGSIDLSVDLVGAQDPATELKGSLVPLEPIEMTPQIIPYSDLPAATTTYYFAYPLLHRNARKRMVAFNGLGIGSFTPLNQYVTVTATVVDSSWYSYQQAWRNPNFPTAVANVGLNQTYGAMFGSKTYPQLGEIGDTLLVSILTGATEPTAGELPVYAWEVL